MESLLDKQIVLKLNSVWQRIGFTTPRKAFVAMCGGAYGGTPPSLGVDVWLDGEGNLSGETRTVTWEEWLDLPVRPGDLAVSLGYKAIRCPTVLVEPNYSHMPVKEPRLTNRAILERDGFRDQYTGELLSRREASVDHIVPKARGGAARSWTNMVTCKKSLNHKKGAKLNHEIGLRLIRAPYKPRAVPVSVMLKEPRHPHHSPFFS